MCAHISPMTCEPAGRNSRGLSALALSTLRLTTLAKTQGGASQRPSALAGPLFVCCCVGQANKVNGATITEHDAVTLGFVCVIISFHLHLACRTTNE